eukprot:2954037-Amphidinium_carterae.1
MQEVVACALCQTGVSQGARVIANVLEALEGIMLGYPDATALPQILLRDDAIHPKTIGTTQNLLRWKTGIDGSNFHFTSSEPLSARRSALRTILSEFHTPHDVLVAWPQCPSGETRVHSEEGGRCAGAVCVFVREAGQCIKDKLVWRPEHGGSTSLEQPPH